jgi:SpoVK/Ycf46/Vps4 family AAA+-type ATPase
MNSFVGQSEQNMRAVFQQIKMMTPLCVWIDEFGRDLSGGASSASVDAGTTDRVHGEFLTGLQELPEDTFLMCAANQIENLRPEMLRADRFDKIVFVGLPSLEERKDIFKICLKTIDTDHQFDLDALAEKAEYFTGAEITALIKEVKFFVVSSELRSINTNDIISYIPNVRNILWNKNRDMIKGMYQYALEQWDWASTEQQKDAKLILSGRKSNSESELAWKI